MNTSISTALDGMNRAAQNFDAAANRIAKTGQPSKPQTSAGVDGDGDSDHDKVDLSSDAVSLLNSRNDYQANAKTVAVADQMTRATIDIFA